MSRNKVYQLTRQLSAYIAYQRTSTFDGFSPAGADAIDAVRAQANDRTRAQAAAQLAALKDEPAVKPSPKQEAKTPEKTEQAASNDGPGLWTTLEVVQPKSTFENLNQEIVGENAAERLQSVRDLLGDCTRCDLCSSRTNIVFGVGNPDARVMIVGEAPGFNEDKKAEPFVGKAGELLNKMIKAIGFEREDVYIANVLKCRPPQNRDPVPIEVQKCAPFLKKQIDVIKPEVIIAMGKFASNTLAGTDGPLGKIRGNWMSFEGTPLMPTFHPAYLLRNESGKRDAWADLQKVMAKLNEASDN